MIRRVAPLAVAALIAAAPISSAQESRTAVLERQRAEKAASTAPYEPGRLERTLLSFEKKSPLRRIAPFNGFFVTYGYPGKPVGSGIGMSAGFRHDLFDRRARTVIQGGGTLRGYRTFRADFSLPHVAGDRVELGIEGSTEHNPQEDFYGIGPDSLSSNRVSFLFDARQVQGRAVLKLPGSVEVGTRLARMSTKVDRGTDKRFPSLEERFDITAAPAFGDRPKFTYNDLFARLDRRDQPGNPRGGGYYGVTWRRYADVNRDRYQFSLLDTDLQQFFPIFDKKRVIAVRGRLTTATADAGNLVPIYFLPTLGGSDTLRSARDYRFRDKTALAMNLEYRWEAFSGLDMALFTDWGNVAPRVEDLDFTRLKRAHGIGLRFNTFKSVFMRMDVALAGAEAPRYFLKFSKVF